MNQIFVLRHWTFTLLSGPLIFAIINGFTSNWNGNNLYGFFQVYPFMVFLGLLSSLPTYIFYFFILFIFKNKNVKMIYKRLILVTIVIIGVFITTALINGIVWLDIAISYSIASIIVGIFFTVYFKNDEEET
jgi:hypothetical protein